MSKFQIILLSVFGFFILVAVAVFALYKGGGASQEASVTIWGDLPSEAVALVLNNKANLIDEKLRILYTEKPSETMMDEFTEALASGSGPDLIILTQDKLWENRSKLVPIPYQSVSERDFKETFVEEAELFLMQDGIYGLPLTIDPLVLYYNRDLLSAAGEARPVAYWDEIYPLTLKLTKRDAGGNLVESAIALGETRNIPNYKEILSLLFLQAGSPVVGFVGSELRSQLSYNPGVPVLPAESGLDFYTQFSNPSKAYYSWNRTLPVAQTHFATGDSAYYIGFASELTQLKNKNPNLNLGVAAVPQSRVSGRTLTYGNIYSAAIARGSRDTVSALRAALLLASAEVAAALSENMALPPVRRDLLSQKKTDTVMPIFYQAALQAKGWLDPNHKATNTIFEEMVNSVTSGRARTGEAVNEAGRKIDILIK